MTIVSEALLAIGIIMVSMAFVLVGGNIVGFQTSGLFQSSQNQISEEISDTIREMPDASAQFSTTYRPGVETYELQVQEGRTITADVPEAGSSSTEFLNYNIQNTVIRNAEEICIQKKSDQVTLERGRCTSPDLDEFCENGRCINDICQPDRGETCTNSGGDCTCSTQCQPNYEAGTYMNPIQGAGDGNDDTNQKECVLADFYGAQDTNGSECRYNFECGTNSGGQNLQCNQPAPNGPNTGSYCCPSGATWDGNQCKQENRYDIVYIPARYSDQSAFETDADQAHSYFVSRSPFNQCSTPANAVNEIKLSISQCNIQNCDITPGGSYGNSDPNRCYKEMRQCANNQLGTGNWNKLVGIAEGNGPVITTPSGATGRLCGRAKNIPSDISVSYSACGTDTVSHEAGHTLGLYHIHGGQGDPGGTVCDLPSSQPNENDGKCRGTPLTERENFIMSYSDTRQEFGPSGLNHMEMAKFSSYLGAC